MNLKVIFLGFMVFTGAALADPQNKLETASPATPDADVIRTLLRTINFEYNSAVLIPSSHEPLGNIAALFKQNPKLRYEVQGHSDFIGTTEFNMLLSAARAMSVKNYLISEGVLDENIVAVGYGMDRPIADNSTEKGRAANRRVEILQIESQEKYEELKENEIRQQEDIQRTSIVAAEPVEPEPVVETSTPESVPEPNPEAEPEERACVPQQKTGMKMGIGIGGFFSNDFGGGFKIPEININRIKIPSTKVKTPWVGGGVKGFFDITYAEIGVGLTFGGGTMEMDAVEVDWSFIALNLSLLGKYPIKLTDNISLFQATGIDYQMVLDTGDYSALWFKFGVGMDIAVSNIMFIRPMLLYGIRMANKWENKAIRPVITGGEEGSTLLGHGLTFSICIGFKL